MKTKAKAKLGGALKVSTARSAQRHGGTISTSASAAQRKAAHQRQPKQRAKAASGTIPARKPAVDDSAWAALRARARPAPSHPTPAPAVVLAPPSFDPNAPSQPSHTALDLMSARSFSAEVAVADRRTEPPAAACRRRGPIPNPFSLLHDEADGSGIAARPARPAPPRAFALAPPSFGVGVSPSRL